VSPSSPIFSAPNASLGLAVLFVDLSFAVNLAIHTRARSAR
jgi:hypothetical protein